MYTRVYMSDELSESRVSYHVFLLALTYTAYVVEVT